MQRRIFAGMQSRIFAEMQSRIFAGMGGVEVSEVSDVGGWRHSSVRVRHNFIPRKCRCRLDPGGRVRETCRIARRVRRHPRKGDGVP